MKGDCAPDKPDNRPSNFSTSNTYADACRNAALDVMAGYLDSTPAKIMGMKEKPVVASIEKKVAQPVTDGGGLRFDNGKNRLDLIPPEWIWALGMVLTKGAEKYAARNWERGMDWSKCVGCAKRHLAKFESGERYDEETGCHHLAMAAWNMLALMTYDIREIGQNDLVGDMKWNAKTVK